MSLLIVIVGPTAIGKTDLAIHLAKELATEIISVDSRQFFREMSIGTAKPSSTELKLVKHHFINSHSIHDECSVGSFETEGLALLAEIFKKQDTVMMVGGSGLYVNAITQGLDQIPKAPKALRDELNSLLSKKGILPLQEKLKTLDPEYYAEVDIHNPQRIIRALEVCIATGQPFSSFRSKTSNNRPFNVLKIGLNTERELLYQRINQRVDQMMAAGLLEEVRALLPYRDLNALQTVGYQEIFDYLDGKCSITEALEQIKQNTRRFAKRQLTWFRKDPEIYWFEPQQKSEILELIRETLNREA